MDRMPMCLLLDARIGAHLAAPADVFQLVGLATHQLHGLPAGVVLGKGRSVR